MENKPRKPWVAGLLSLLLVGLGHAYAGKAKKGMILYVGQALLAFLLVLFLVVKLNVFLLLFVVIVLLIYFLFCLVDAVKTARQSRTDYTLKKYNKWYVYLLCIVLVSFIIEPVVQALVKENAIQAFKIPGGSMKPTLLVGDHILVNKFIYKTREPQRGDVIVFKYPEDPSKDFVKRLIGVGGDVIEIREKRLYVNKIEQNEDYAIHCDPRQIGATFSGRDNFGPITVPSDSLFFMGDNRDNSHDSRFWGFVPIEDILGKVMVLYWSWDKKAGIIRWNRIGKKIKQITRK